MPSKPPTRPRRWLQRFLAATRGNVALVFALALPPVAVAAVGGIQLSYVVNARTLSQDVADSAALAGAQQMSLSPVGAADRAKSWAQTQLAQRGGNSSFTVSTSTPDAHTLKVAIDAYTPSFFGDMLPKGGFKSHAEATAEQQSQAPLCVLIDGAAGDQLHMTGSTKLSGTCLVHGNGDVVVDGAASITASRVEAGGASSGPGQVTPTVLTGAPTVTDPFAAMNLTFPKPCAPTHMNGIILPSMSPPSATSGVVQDDWVIPNNMVVAFSPGIYYFCGKLSLGNMVTLTGSNVTLVFDKASVFDAKNNDSITLSGSQSGPFAGFVIVTARNLTGNWKLPTDPFAAVTGAIYTPTGQLELNGTKNAGAASDWTVIAAKALQVTGQANLQINTNYSAAFAPPVPIGVGNKAASGGAVRLSR